MNSNPVLSADPLPRYTTVAPALPYNSKGWLSAPERTSARPPPLQLVRNQNRLGLSVRAASSHGHKLHQKFSQVVSKIKACYHYHMVFLWPLSLHIGKEIATKSKQSCSHLLVKLEANRAVCRSCHSDRK